MLLLFCLQTTAEPILLLLQQRNAAPKENLFELLKESSVRGRRNKKDVFVKAQHFYYTNSKNLFSKMMKLTIE
ncbi:hypothetical protein AV530_005285 [Patagioenas fasciata monilis]|uniref:Uncharacterized protein n=1 Tax=Patagioenas fasciata monilis TaxID=372326 RepID=A0A1V4JKR2_PATFA|nr:hypothetical protein AV530_005285 [Patagioenas fasciata monilis]